MSDAGLKTAIAYGVAMKGDEIAVPSIFIVHKGKIVFHYVGESIMDRPDAERIVQEVDIVLSKKD